MNIFSRCHRLLMCSFDPVRRHIRTIPSFLGRMSEINGELIPANSILARQYPGASAVELSFRYGDEQVRERVFNLSRNLQEPVSTTFLRMQANIGAKRKKLNKKTKKHVNPPEASAVQSEQGAGEACDSDIIKLFDSRQRLLDDTITNELGWIEGNTLQINDSRYSIIKNHPLVRRLVLPKAILSGLPLYPFRCTVDFCSDEAVTSSVFSKTTEDDDADENQAAAASDQRLCRFYWLREHTKAMPKITEESFDLSHESADTQNILREPGWQMVANERFYIPSHADEGRLLRLIVVPVSLQGKAGGARTITSAGKVQKTPVEHFPFLRREFKSLSDATDGASVDQTRIKVLSYNILADLYADTAAARTELFYYCPAEYRSMEYRQRVILTELAHYDCDILCLQEVDTRIFLHALNPFLREKHGMQGLLKTKFNVAEGCATYFRMQKFRFVRSHDVIISEMVQIEPLFAELKEQIDAAPEFAERFWGRTSALQVTVLEHRHSQRLFCVANTHLFFEADADDVRLMQMGACLTYIDNIVQACAIEFNKSPVVLFCGDFNSTAEMSTHELLRTGFVSNDNADWQTPRAVKKEQQQPPDAAMSHERFTTEFSHSLKIDTACGVPCFTNFTAGFKDTLDWIYYDTSALAVTKVLSMPSVEDCSRHVALPSCEFPSDHIAIGCELQLLEPRQQ